MRVPELDWPLDLFQDVAPIPDLPMTIAAQIQTAGQKPLWAAMRGVWMRGANEITGSPRHEVGGASI